MKTEMTIDQKLEIIREAMEKGAQVQLHFFHIPSRKQGESLIDRMAEITGGTKINNEDIETFRLDHFSTPVDCSVYYSLDNEEKKEKLLQELKWMNEKGGEAIEQAN